MGWLGTDSAKVQAELTVELFISEDKSFVECTWTAGASLYEFFGEEELCTGNEDAVERYDISSLNGGLQVAVRVLEEWIGVDQSESARQIVEQLQKELSE